MMYTPVVKFTPIGEYLRLVVLRRLSRGPAPVEEVDELVKKVVEKLGIRYDWRVWPRLVEGEVAVKDGVATITLRGKWVLEQTAEEVAKYVKRWLGVEA